MVSRAIHVEALTSLDTSTFRLALRRFFAIRGTSTRLRSDHGTNFLGAKNQMENDIDITALKRFAQNEGCVWEFVPPYASHFAGVWERKVGAIKSVLSSSIQQAGLYSLSRDEFYTLIQEAANIVNRTPLCEVSSDPNDPFPVSPSTLLIMRDEPSDSPPELFSEKDILQYGKLRWRRVQFLADQFWIRWKRNYISTVQARNKWRSVKINLKPGDIVLVREKSPRNSWPLARIVSVKVSKDDLVRLSSYS